MMEPTFATYDVLGQVLTVTFNHNLVIQPLDAANWTGRLDGRFRTATIATAVNGTVVANMDTGSPDPGVDVCNYAPPPDDVVSIHGPVAPAFSDFPVTLI